MRLKFKTAKQILSGRRVNCSIPAGSSGSIPTQARAENPRKEKVSIEEMGHVSEHHEATDGLVKLLTKANHDLTVVQRKLEREFQQIYPDNANPMKLVSRIKKIQEELPILKEQCRQLLSAKQDLIDKARVTLVGNRNLVQRMEASMGVSPDIDSDDSAFANFNQIIDEWTVQVRSKTGDEIHDSDAEDINQLLFSAIVQSN